VTSATIGPSSPPAGDAGQIGFGRTFPRRRNLYIAYSEAGFRSGYPGVHQLVAERARR
jgi:hypothetical protein